MLTAEQKIKRYLLGLVWPIIQEYDYSRLAESRPDFDLPEDLATLEDPEVIDHVYEWLSESSDYLHDAEQDVRYNWEYETDIPCPSIQHYQCKSVAMQLSCGTWIGYNYWYGGGKYGEPGAIDWIRGAYELEYSEETRVVKRWSKKSR